MQQQQNQTLNKIGQMVSQLEMGEKENAATLHKLHQQVSDPAIAQQLRLLEDKEQAAAQTLAQIKTLCGVSGTAVTTTKA
ncbi:MAG: hypothetical protein ACM3ZQ_00460 [Bacillota bacterium]